MSGALQKTLGKKTTMARVVRSMGAEWLEVLDRACKTRVSFEHQHRRYKDQKAQEIQVGGAWV